jgi:RimJ/RimL family protein N-acetyltransferase
MLTETFAARAALRRVVAFVHPDNAASARLLERAGFARTAARAADGWDGFALMRETPPRA